jgi:hypothetical protein
MRNFHETNPKSGNSAKLNPFCEMSSITQEISSKHFVRNFLSWNFFVTCGLLLSPAKFNQRELLPMVNHFILLQLNTIQLVLASDGTASFRDDAQLRPTCHNLLIAHPFTTVTIYYTLSEPF